MSQENKILFPPEEKIKEYAKHESVEGEHKDFKLEASERVSDLKNALNIFFDESKEKGKIPDEITESIKNMEKMLSNNEEYNESSFENSYNYVTDFIKNHEAKDNFSEMEKIRINLANEKPENDLENKEKIINEGLELEHEYWESLKKESERVEMGKDFAKLSQIRNEIEKNKKDGDLEKVKKLEVDYFDIKEGIEEAIEKKRIRTKDSIEVLDIDKLTEDFYNNFEIQYINFINENLVKYSKEKIDEIKNLDSNISEDELLKIWYKYLDEVELRSEGFIDKFKYSLTEEQRRNLDGDYWGFHEKTFSPEFEKNDNENIKKLGDILDNIIKDLNNGEADNEDAEEKDERTKEQKENDEDIRRKNKAVKKYRKITIDNTGNLENHKKVEDLDEIYELLKIEKLKEKPDIEKIEKLNKLYFKTKEEIDEFLKNEVSSGRKKQHSFYSVSVEELDEKFTEEMDNVVGKILENDLEEEFKNFKKFAKSDLSSEEFVQKYSEGLERINDKFSEVEEKFKYNVSKEKKDEIEEEYKDFYYENIKKSIDDDPDLGWVEKKKLKLKLSGSKVMKNLDNWLIKNGKNTKLLSSAWGKAKLWGANGLKGVAGLTLLGIGFTIFQGVKWGAKGVKWIFNDIVRTAKNAQGG